VQNASSAKTSERETGTRFLDRFKAKVRSTNPILELAIVLPGLVAAGWIWVPLGVITHSTFFEYAGYFVVGAFLTWMAMIAHAIRKRNLDDLGFTSIKRFGKNLQSIKQRREAWNYFLIVGTILAGYFIFLVNFLPFTSLIPFLGEINTFIAGIVHPAVNVIIATLEFLFFGVFTAFYFFKTDNIKASLLRHAKYGTPVLLFLFTFAMIVNQDKVFSQTFMKVVAHFLGYIFWAMFQQIPTLVYVNTSMREGLEKSTRITSPSKRRFLAAFVTASFFAILHFPAFILAMIAFTFEFILSMIYYDKKFRNVFVACLLHAATGVIVVFFLDIDLIAGYVGWLG